MAEGLDSDEKDRQKKTESILLWVRNVEIATQQGPHVSYQWYLHNLYCARDINNNNDNNLAVQKICYSMLVVINIEVSFDGGSVVYSCWAVSDFVAQLS
jgi:ribosomal protein L20